MCLTRSMTKRMVEKEHLKRKTKYVCMICLSTYQNQVGYSTPSCQHMMCLTCARGYLDSILKNKRQTSFEKIPCCFPDCAESFTTIDIIDDVLPEADAARWWRDALLASCFENKITCPFDDCKAIYDTETANTKKCTFGVCYECHRGFCIACQSLWRPDEMVYRNEEEDIKNILILAQNSKWCRCPKCEHLVEKIDGCSTISCICGIKFCYKCGGFSHDHTCTNRCNEYSLLKLEETRRVMFDRMKKVRSS